MGQAARFISSVAALVAVAANAAAADQGWYVGAGIARVDLGLVESDIDDGSMTSSRLDNTDSGWKVLGGYRFGRHFALEGAYVDLNNDYDGNATFNGNSDGSGPVFAPGPVTVDIQPRAVYVAAVGTIPIGNAALFGKAGIVRWEADITVADSSTSLDDTDRGTDTLIGAGIEYRFANGIAVRAEFERFRDLDGTDVDLATIGVTYRFDARR